jgi:hypothetical protein
MKNHGDKLIESERDCTLLDSEDQMLDFRVGCVFIEIRELDFG